MPTQKFWRGTPYARPLADRGGKGREGRKTEREKRGRKQEKGKRGKLEQGRRLAKAGPGIRPCKLQCVSHKRTKFRVNFDTAKSRAAV